MQALRNSDDGAGEISSQGTSGLSAWKNVPESSAATTMREAVENNLTEAHLPSVHAITSGVVERVILNTPDPHDETISEIAQRVSTANHSLLLETYIFDVGSEAARELCDAVARRQETCPSFRCVIIYNALSSSSKHKLQRLADTCGATISLVPHDQGWSRRSLHSKIAIIDGQRAIIGGSNVDNPKETDIAVELTGSVVKGLVVEFVSLLREIRREARGRRAQDTEKLTNSVERDMLEGLPQPPPATEHPMLLLTKTGQSWWGTHYSQVSNAALLDAIDAAKDEICIRSPNVNDVHLLAALSRAAERGVTVNILLPKGYFRVASFIDCAGNYAPLIYKAQRVDREHAHYFNIRWYSDDGGTTSPSHAKLFMIDGIPVVGSQNADNQSFCFSRELSIAICSPEEGEKIRAQLFDDAWEKGIEAPIHFLHHLLPIPESPWQKRITRIVYLPSLIFQNCRQFLRRAAVKAAQG